MGRPAELNPLALGFYTVPEAARLIEFGSANRIRGWLRGYRGRQIGPLITRAYAPLGGHEEVSFLDLMELRLIETLREQDIKPRTIRAAIKEARTLFKLDKPFATDRIVLKTDGKSVFVEEVLRKVAQAENDRRLWNLITKQYEHYELIERSLITGVTFDPDSHVAKQWVPRPDLFPDIYIDPRIALGRPVTPSLKPTDAIFELWQAEQEDVGAAADWFNISPEEADMAIRFERELAKPREILNA